MKIFNQFKARRAMMAVGNPAAEAIVRWADARQGGNIEHAILDAADGMVGAAAADLAAAMIRAGFGYEEVRTRGDELAAEANRKIIDHYGPEYGPVVAQAVGFIAAGEEAVIRVGSGRSTYTGTVDFGLVDGLIEAEISRLADQNRWANRAALERAAEAVGVAVKFLRVGPVGAYVGHDEAGVGLSGGDFAQEETWVLHDWARAIIETSTSEREVLEGLGRHLDSEFAAEAAEIEKFAANYTPESNPGWKIQERIAADRARLKMDARRYACRPLAEMRYACRSSTGLRMLARAVLAIKRAAWLRRRRILAGLIAKAASQQYAAPAVESADLPAVKKLAELVG